MLVALWRETTVFGRIVQAGSVLTLAIVAVWGGSFIIHLQTDPKTAALTPIDRAQYLERWSAGHDMPAVVARIEQLAAQAGDTGIMLVSPTYSGYDAVLRTVHIAPQLYLRDNERVQFTILDVTAPDAAEQFHALARQQPTYILLDSREREAFAFSETFPSARLLATYENPLSAHAFYLFQMTAPDNASS
jgi:hypothetical protein